MEYNIQFSPKALSDLNATWEYISKELNSPVAAEKTIQGIMHALDTLKTFPKAGTPLRLPHNISSNYRFILYKDYMGFYRVSESHVFVDRILYGKQDYLKFLMR